MGKKWPPATLFRVLYNIDHGPSGHRSTLSIDSRCNSAVISNRVILLMGGFGATVAPGTGAAIGGVLGSLPVVVVAASGNEPRDQYRCRWQNASRPCEGARPSRMLPVKGMTA
jgi:hypothetical protein